MADRIEQIHLAHPQQKDLGNRERKIDQPEALRRIPDVGVELIRRGPGHLGGEKLHAADPQVREDDQGQQDDSHSAQPLRQAPPEQDGMREFFDVV